MATKLVRKTAESADRIAINIVYPADIIGLDDYISNIINQVIKEYIKIELQHILILTII